MVEVITTRVAEEHFFRSPDGTHLFYRYWPAPYGRDTQAVILFHRGHEHSGRLQHIVDELDLPQIAAGSAGPGVIANPALKKKPQFGDEAGADVARGAWTDLRTSSRGVSSHNGGMSTPAQEHFCEGFVRGWSKRLLGASVAIARLVLGGAGAGE